MPKRAAGLTARQVETKKTAGYYADGRGLYLQVTDSGAKTWIFRYSLDGRRRDMGFGPAADVTLAEAFIAAHRAGWRNEKHAAQWLDTALVLRALEPIWSAKSETATTCGGSLAGRWRPSRRWLWLRRRRAAAAP